MTNEFKFTKTGEVCAGCNLIGGCICTSIDDQSCANCFMHKNHCLCPSVVKVLKAIQKPVFKYADNVIAVNFTTKKRE